MVGELAIKLVISIDLLIQSMLHFPCSTEQQNNLGGYNMKKLLVTTVAAAAIAAGFGGQVDAASNQPQVYTQVHTIQVGNVNQDQINKLIEKFSQNYKQYQPVNQQPVKAPVATPKQPAVKQPAPAKQPAQAQEPTTEKKQQTAGVSQQEQQMIDLVNKERTQRGLQPLKANLELTKVARVKAQDMIDKNYFSHQSPTYGSPFEMLNKFGIQYRTAGENLAGNQTVEAAHQALMNSEGHRANILKGDYTEIGIGVIDGGPYGKMFVQLFKG